MPFVGRPCGAAIHFTVRGTGPIPVLLLAPGGMRSHEGQWGLQPYDPLRALPRDRFTLVAMDQRHAGRSATAPLRAGDGWATFAADQLAVLDAAGVGGGRRCHLLGSCIGPSYQLALLRDAPERFARAVLVQPIGRARHTTEPGGGWAGENEPAATAHWFGDWADEMARDGRAARAELDALRAAMFGGARDFVFSASRDDVRRVRARMLVLMGRDVFHPSETARELARLAPRATLIEEWRDAGPGPLDAAAAAIEAFLDVDPDADDAGD